MSGVDLRAREVARSRGRWYAVMSVHRDDVAVFAEKIALDRAEERRAFVAAVLERLPNGDGAAIEAELMRFLDAAIAEREAEADDGPRRSQADQLVEIAEACDLFHDAMGDAYARFDVDGHRECWSTQSTGFGRWLRLRFWLQFEKAPNGKAVSTARAVIDARAHFEGPERPVYLRVAPDGLGGIVLDLGAPDWRVAHVTPSGVRVVSDLDVCFRRPRGMLALPDPVLGGSLDALRPFIHVRDDDAWARVKGWLRAALRPEGPHAILALYGEHGSGKTSAAEMLRSLVDPARPMLRAEPRDERDLAIAAKWNWVVGTDNASNIQPWLSDAMCRLSTGSGVVTRALYSNDEEAVFDAVRPQLLTGITEYLTRPDVLDRTMQETLVAIDERQRRQHSELWREFESARPLLLGALLEDAAAGLRELPRVRLARLPRMADVATWTVAVERGRGEPERFLHAFDLSRGEGHDQALESSSIGTPMRTVAADVLAFGDPWEGTAQELLHKLTGLVDEKVTKSKAWPKSPRGLRGELTRLAPAIRSLGVDVQFGKRAGKRGERLIVIAASTPGGDVCTDEGKEPRPSAPPAPSADSPDQRGEAPETADGRRADADGHAATADGGAASTDGADGRADGATRRADGADGAAAPSSGGIVYIGDSAALDAALPILAAATELGLDTETTGLDPRQHRVRLVQLAVPGGSAYVLDAFRIDIGALAPILAAGSPRLIGHNLRFDLGFLAAAGLPMPDGDRLFDTMLAGQLLGAGTPDGRLDRCGLAALGERVLGVTLDKTAQASDWSGALTDGQIAYAASDAETVLALGEKLEAELTAARLTRVAGLEMRALPAIAWLERTGAPFDSEAWATLSDGAVAEQIGIEAELGELIGDATVNCRSPHQMMRVLRARGHDIERTDEVTLTRLAPDEPIARALLRYREASRRASAYGIEFLRHVHPTTDRIHADYRQLGTETGRMSCTQPNLQNIPRDPAYRACFRPAPGRVLIKADYSQIELRIAAEMAKDPRMLDAYRNGEDFHTVTAATVLGRQNGAVTKDDRQLAKVVNFGLLYGMGAERLREYAAQNYGVVLALNEAEAFRNGFFRAYPGLRAWHRRQGNAPNGATETRTLAGRRRLAVERYTERLNTPVQGTGADGLKAALALLWESRDRVPSAAPVLCVHDEIVLEVDEGEADAAREWLIECMTRGMRAFLREVPVEVEATIVAAWSGTPVADAMGMTT